MIKIKPLWIQVGCAVVFFFLIKLFLSYIILSSFSRIVIDAEFDHEDVIEVFYSVNHSFEKILSQRSQVFAGGKKSTAKILLYNQVARRLRIDLGNHPGQVKIYGVTLFSFFGPEIHFDPKQIHEQFTPNSAIASSALEGDHVLVVSQTEDPFLIFNGKLRHKSFFFSTVAPLIFSYLFFLVISNFPLRKFPAIYDLNHKTSSTGVNIGSLDGIRGLAALMVLAAHTGIQRGSIGSLGVWLFFTLSGFLLATPFARNPGRAVSYSYMSTYLIRRLKRIIPMYYTYITITMLFLNRNPEVFRHYLFLQGDGHLWTISQEMLFYLILPVVMAAMYVLCKGNRLAGILVLLIIIYLVKRFLTINVVSLYGYGTMLPSHAGIFLMGVLASYVYHWLGENSFFQRMDDLNFRRTCSALGLPLIIALIVLSAHLIKKISYFDALNYSGIFGFFSGVFILLVVLSRDTLLGRIMSFFPLRAVGLVGFSFYLLHPLLLSFYMKFSGYYFHLKPNSVTLFLATGILTYFLSAFTYTYIERPFLKTPHVSMTDGGEKYGKAVIEVSS